VRTFIKLSSHRRVHAEVDEVSKKQVASTVKLLSKLNLVSVSEEDFVETLQANSSRVTATMTPKLLISTT
jgi:hypothetical protein